MPLTLVAPPAPLRGPRPPTNASAFEVLAQRTDLGERFFMLIDAESGLPPVLALRFALYQRGLGGSEPLRRRLRNLAWLYEWTARCGRDGTPLEDRLRAMDFLDTDELQQAMVYADRGGPVDIGPDEFSGTLRMVRIARPTSHNTRVQDWCDFLKWACKRRTWSTGRPRRDTPFAQAQQATYQDELETFTEGALRRRRSYRSRTGLSPWECEMLDAIIAPDEAGEFVQLQRRRGPPRPVWGAQLLWRNYLLYAVMRWAGLRRSEALKLKVQDLPTPIMRDGEIVAWSNEGRLMVRRRVDDPEDTRDWEPRVKRWDRNTGVIDHQLLVDLYRYTTTPIAAGGRSDATNAYLFLATSGRPLSIASTTRIKQRVRELASWHAASLKPGAQHTLARFTWHRLRHTRAAEVWEEKWNDARQRHLDGLPPTPWEQSFLDEFGWQSMASASPYIRKKHFESGVMQLGQHVAHLHLVARTR